MSQMRFRCTRCGKVSKGTAAPYQCEVCGQVGSFELKTKEDSYLNAGMRKWEIYRTVIKKKNGGYS